MVVESKINTDNIFIASIINDVDPLICIQNARACVRVCVCACVCARVCVWGGGDRIKTYTLIYCYIGLFLGLDYRS